MAGSQDGHGPAAWLLDIGPAVTLRFTTARVNADAVRRVRMARDTAFLQKPLPLAPRTTTVRDLLDGTLRR